MIQDADNTAINALAARMYAAFDNCDGRVPDLDSLREVFLPQCTICKAIPGQEQVQSLDEFIEQRRPLLTQGRLVDFSERETDSRTWIAGNIASRESLYEKSGVLDATPFRTRGAKQMQFVRLDGRWWISALAWDDAREGFEPPASLDRNSAGNLASCNDFAPRTLAGIMRMTIRQGGDIHMRHASRFLLPAALTIALAACGKPAEQTATVSSAAGDATPAASATPAATPADSGFVLTMDKVDAYYATIGKMSQAAMQSAASGSSDEGEDADDPTAMDASETVDQYIARIEADPKAKALVTSAGMSVSDYAHTNEALTAGMMTAGALESGALKKIPDGIDPQYVEFAQQHKAELEAKLKALQAQYGG